MSIIDKTEQCGKKNTEPKGLVSSLSAATEEVKCIISYKLFLTSLGQGAVCIKYMLFAKLGTSYVDVSSLIPQQSYELDTVISIL